jgi:hypothetical protein
VAKKKIPPVSDLTLFPDFLNFFPPDAKNAMWMAQGIFFSKQNSVVFLDPKRKEKYRKLEKGELDTREYINMIDPPTTTDGGGKAEYFSSDFKTCPIDVHIDNIVRAKLDKICLENKIQVNEIDKFALSQKQREMQKVIYQREFRSLINEINQKIGLPPIKESQDIYAYIQELNSEESQQVTGNIDKTLEYIRGQIKDSQDLQLYDAYVYKGDVERAFEMGIQHYLMDLNKWSIIGEWFNNDIKNFEKACGMWYTDETNGRGTVDYFEPDRLFTSPFKRNNGEDITMWHYEYPITFAEFVRRFGTTMTDEELKEVFEINRNSGTRHGMSWAQSKSFKGSMTNIMVGKFSILTQDAESFSEEFANNKIPLWTQKPPSWFPKENNSDAGESKRQKIYNTWYTCDYVPPPGDRQSRNQMIDWLWQSRYIFNLKKEVDMYRYGVDMRYAKSALVLYKDDTRMSYTDVKEAFMPKIRNTWHKFQNCLIQDVQSLGISKDFIGAVLNAVDEGNKIDPGDPAYPTGGNGMDPSIQSMRMIKQGGMVFLDFRDKQGNYIADPSKLFVPIDSGHMAKAERYLKSILEQYNLMQIALAQNSMTEGQGVKSHQNATGVQAVLSANDDGMWYVEKPSREFLKMYAERCVQWILMVVKEHKLYGFKERWEEMQNVIGLANAWMMESVEELQPEQIGITVELEDVKALQQYVVELANKMADQNQVSRAAVGLVMNTAKNNWKYGYCLLMIEAKKQEEQNAHKEDLQFQRQMALEKEKTKQALALVQAKAQGKDSNIQHQGQVDMAVNDALNKGKAQSMAEQKQQLLNNKLSQDNNKANLQKGQETYDAIAPPQR